MRKAELQNLLIEEKSKQSTLLVLITQEQTRKQPPINYRKKNKLKFNAELGSFGFWEDLGDRFNSCCSIFHYRKICH